MEERDIDNLFNQIQQIKQQASTLNQSVENSKIQKTKQIRQLSNMESNENNADQFSLMGTLNNSNFFSNNIERTKVKSNTHHYGSNNEIETPSLTPQLSGNLNLQNQQQNAFQQIWSQQLYNSSIPQKSPNSAFHSKSPSSINTANRQGSQSIHYTPNQQQTATPYNNKRQMQQQGNNTPYQKQILNSNSKDKLAKRIEFNNQNDSSMISCLTPHSYSPINASRRLPLMNDQVNIQQNNFMNLHQSQSQQLSPHIQLQQQQQQFKGHNQIQLQQNLKMQQLAQQQYQSQPSQQQRAKMFSQTNMVQNQNQQQQLSQNQLKAQQQKKQMMPQQNQISNQQLRQIPFMQQHQQFQQQLQNQRQNQMNLKQYQEQYNFDMADPHLISNQHYLSDGILATNEENDYQQEQDTFEDQGYNQEDEIEEQENMYNDFLTNSQQNQLSSSYNSKNQDMKNQKKLQYQYYLQQQQSNQPGEILRTPQGNQSQFSQYMKAAKNNPSTRSNHHHDYQSLNSFNTPKMSKVPYTSENPFPFNQQQIANNQMTPNQLTSINPQTNLNQYFFDQGKSEEDYPQMQNNSRQQQSISARDNSRIRITPNNQESDSKFVPPRATSNNKNSSIQNYQNQPTKLKKNIQNFQNQYQLLQSPDQNDTDEDFLSNITNQPSPILPQNSNQINYFPSRDQSFLNLGNTNPQIQQGQQNNNNFIRSKIQRERSSNNSVSSQMINQNLPFQQTFSQYSQGIQLQPQYNSVGGSIQDQIPNQKQNSHRVSKYSKQNLDSSMISARKTPSKSQGPRKSPTPVRQTHHDQQEDEKMIQLKKQLQDSQGLVQKLQDELRSTKEELEDYKYAFQKTVQKYKQVQKHMDQKGAKAQIAYYQKSLIKEKSLNKNLKEVNINIKRKILKLRSVVYDQYIKDSEEFLSLQNDLRQYELQNEFLRDILQIGSLNDQKCESVNKILEKEEEIINKNQEPPNQEKLIERQRNKRLIERIACEEENFSDENDENYIKRLIKNQKEIEDQKRQEDNSNFNNIFGLILAQATKPTDMRDEYEDKNMDQNQIQQGNFAIHPVSPSQSSSDDKGEIPTNSSLNNSLSSDSSQIQLNTSLNSQLSDDSKKGGINSTSVLNSQNKVPPLNSSQLNQGNQQSGSTSMISSQSLLTSTTPSNKLSIGSTSLVSPIQSQASNANNNQINQNPPKVQTSLRGKSIFSDISSRVGGFLGSSTISPQNRLKSPDPIQRTNSNQQKTQESLNQSSFSIKKNLESTQDKQTQQQNNNQSSQQTQNLEQKFKQSDLSQDSQSNQMSENSFKNDNSIIKNNNIQDQNSQNAFTFENCDDDNFNILDENNSDDDGPISEDDILGTNINPYLQSQNNSITQNQQDSNVQSNTADQQNKTQNKSFISNSSFFAPSNTFANTSQTSQNNQPPQNNNQISNNSLAAPQNQQQNSQNQPQKQNFISSQSFFAPTNNNNIATNNSTNESNNGNNITNSTNSNSKPLIAAQSSFISSNSYFSSSGNNFVPYGGGTQKKNKDDENVVLLPDYKYEPLTNQQYEDQAQTKDEQKQNIQQQEQKKEEINFMIPLK